ncbi:MAG TPA: DUF4440 domain-containing protein [Planctomycetota bacterium]
MQYRLFLAGLLLAAIPLPQDPAVSPSAAARDVQEIEAAVRAFVRAIDEFDLAGVDASFAASATAFYPFCFTPHRLDGKAAILEQQERGFVWAREQLVSIGRRPPFTLGLQPTAMKVQRLGDDVAVVTWHSDRSGRAGRRTSVLQKLDGRWRTVHHHASNQALPQAGER